MLHIAIHLNYNSCNCEQNEKPIIGIHIPAQPQALNASELMKIKVPPSTIEKLKSQAFVLRNQTFCV